MTVVEATMIFVVALCFVSAVWLLTSLGINADRRHREDR